jgi:hypothetical protein
MLGLDWLWSLFEKSIRYSNLGLSNLLLSGRGAQRGPLEDTERAPSGLNAQRGVGPSKVVKAAHWRPGSRACLLEGTRRTPRPGSAEPIRTAPPGQARTAQPQRGSAHRPAHWLCGGRRRWSPDADLTAMSAADRVGRRRARVSRLVSFSASHRLHRWGVPTAAITGGGHLSAADVIGAGPGGALTCAGASVGRRRKRLGRPRGPGARARARFFPSGPWREWVDDCGLWPSAPGGSGAWGRPETALGVNHRIHSTCAPHIQQNQSRPDSATPRTLNTQQTLPSLVRQLHELPYLI